MAEGNYVIAYDLGTTGNKATLYSSMGTLEASTFVGYDTYFPHPNWAEQDPEEWWRAVCIATKDLLEKGGINPSQIACVCFSGQMMGCVPVTRDVKPLGRAIIWADQRAVKQAQRLTDSVGESEVYKITGHRPSAAYSAAKIMWLMDHEKESFSRIYKVLHAKDFVIARLTGQFVTDYSDASGMNLFDIRRLSWSKEILLAAQIPEGILPEPRPSTDIVGSIQKDVAHEVGLLPGTPVVIGGGDGACAAAGAGVVREGSAYNYVGSSSWIGVATGQPLYDREMRTFNWVHVVPGMYSPTGTMQAAGASYQWLRDQLCLAEVQRASVEGKSPYSVMDEEALNVPAGAGGLLYLPYLMGERSPRWNPKARGALIGLSITHTRAHLIRAVMEGVAYNLKVILDAFLEQGARIESVRLIGGGAKGQVWPRILADVYQIPILKAAHLDEATSLGAAITGGVGVGLFDSFDIADRLFKATEQLQPNPDNVEKYRDLYKLFNAAYSALENVFSELGTLRH
ncbi:MAG: xylulokinase [Thermoanaerobacteraceae bacterium]|nr:xylulokinase [Thermoanaerobacteraceae bacterium]